MAKTEDEEISELNELIRSGGTSRDSPITASKYNKWLVGEQNRAAGAVVCGEVDNLRKSRVEFQKRHAALNDRGRLVLERWSILTIRK